MKEKGKEEENRKGGGAVFYKRLPECGFYRRLATIDRMPTAGVLLDVFANVGAIFVGKLYIHITILSNYFSALFAFPMMVYIFCG